ncbi:MAG: Asp-tRNA(Asn)/Glu-tRNA(Gln) amidotransferase subunit GatB [Alphaproteobacteria bacterium]|nr:Asp-tRNA(Asn)/Glu-tRNA(Gln) amidotransferase subunit GatB [Alphaproteobacteria bacterium]MBU1512850.1 Asp-tRNA(Asn)/Glu-tRNA(Gln) amidotransferase subunit GatB [Alphaproteobacteria bacterium]MBU2095714.1 Asp-tRNA(Asn)/Glu-tRNA(Gln) amidotransferase subunit GatB [Alphaproteobacteria bacterium]MBU2152800.1 Asp-tRNA(Asn)/Glu-tRNA(Gln) amidotransferase subunit GatB [Alphaproteobacteria bacterium]MBU2309018.1 Asp-tRNA(Asn)/Glu-tRNA(Gln) amidotransferase subunit GatB [Alphaproteobacteria bacterium
MSEANSKVIQGRTGPWEIVLGLEVHAQVASNAKLFSGAAVGAGAAPNAQVSLVDAAMPGMLPVINRHCVEQAIKTGLGLKAQINNWSRFDRKNYFYPDLPQGYQISQFKDPIVGEGEVIVERDDGSTFTVRIERLHLEQDAGKSLHDQDPNYTYVDLNRSGTALMEIVSKPDMRTSEEAAAYVKKLRTILIYLGTCDGDMEKGNLRADVNVSVCRPGAYEKFRETGDFSHLGTRCEIKNVNSYRYIQQAIEYEARRQIEIIEDGGKIDQETRLFDPTRNETRSMRSKEEAHDYRYFPDPDLLPLVLDPAWVKAIEATLPELPDAKKARLQTQYGLTAYDAGVLIIEQARADFYESAVKGRDAKLTANWVTNDLAARLTAGGIDIENSPIAPAAIAELVQLIEEGVISSKIAKDVFERMWAGEGGASEIVDKQGLKQVSDTGELEKIIDDLIAANPGQAAQVKEKPQAIGWFVGQIMKATGGKANPGVINQMLKAKLGA